jgi:hypothetical protein
VVCAGERAAINIDGGARWERLAPVTLDNLDCLELIYGPHRSICLDLTFAILPPIDGPYATLDLIADRYVLLVPAGSPLAEAGCGQTPQRSSGRSDDNRTVLAFVAAGTGIALVPELALDGHDERMCVLDVDGLLAPRRLGLTWHRDRQPSPAARVLMELARSVCGPLGAASAA